MAKTKAKKAAAPTAPEFTKAFAEAEAAPEAKGHELIDGEIPGSHEEHGMRKFTPEFVTAHALSQLPK